MSYADFAFFSELYGDSLTEQDFARLSWEADRELDRQTTGLDNVRKLRIAFPTDEDDAETVKRCECALVNLMHQIEEAEKVQQAAQGFVQREDGTMMSKVVSSVSSGSESISYGSKDTSFGTAISAASDIGSRKSLFSETVKQYLSGVVDANGVNLLYRGAYPRV